MNVPSKRSRRRRLFLEPLEDRRLLATFEVNSTSMEPDSYAFDGMCDTANNPLSDPPTPPSGVCTLRAAVSEANFQTSNDRIVFKIDVPEGVVPRIEGTINGGGITGTLEIDGTTQEAGMVEIHGSVGVGGGSTIRGLVITGGGIGIGGDNNTIVGNIIGLDPSGAPDGNVGAGIFILNSSGNTIGGVGPGERNIISGNGNGIVVQGSVDVTSNNNVIIGNYIGTDFSGTIVDPDGLPGSGDELGNANGIVLSFGTGTGNRIGGPTEAERNVIAGNKQDAISIFSGAQFGVVADTTIQGNYIGVDATGTVALGNLGRGIAATLASNTTIADNVVSANTRGISLGENVTGTTITGNKIGTDATGNVVDPDGVPGNGNEFGNREYGIHLQPTRASAVTTNNTIGGSAAGKANLISGNNVGIHLFDRADGNTIEGNLIGTNANGTGNLGNGKGIEILFRSKNVIAGNTVSGNTTGIEIAGSTATDNLVANNRIGVNGQVGATPPADAPLPNGVGILINDAPGNCIGGVFPVAAGAATLCAVPAGNPPSPIAGNLISGNTTYGVQIANANAANNVVQGNKIGTDATGQVTDPDGAAGTGDELGNGFDGVFLGLGARNNTIGGTIPTKRNIISGNLGDGIIINGAAGSPATANLIIGNFIGTNVDGDAPLPNLFRGIHIDQFATGNIVGGGGTNRNVISANGADGVIIFGGSATGNVIKENLIGTDVTGTKVDPDGIPNNGDELGNKGAGVYILDAASNLIGQIGENNTGFFRNLISGNVDGIRIEGPTAQGNIVEGNLIGVDLTGSKKLKNTKNGIFILNAPLNRIGTQTSLPPGSPNFPGNVISGNGASGIRVEGLVASRNFIGGNLIGAKSSGAEVLGNTSHGIEVVGAPKTRIGFSLPGEPPISGNTLAGNFDGVRLEGADTKETLIGGNFIGTAWQANIPVAPDFEAVPAAQPVLLANTRGINIRHGSENSIGGLIDLGNGQSALIPGNVIAGNFQGVQITELTAISNTIQRNSIFANGSLGIDLGGDGVTPNDLMDVDGNPASQPNTLQNFPLLDNDVDEDGRLTGSLNSTPDTEFTIDFYISKTADPSGNGEGEIWVGKTTATTDEDGNGDFEFQIALARLASRNVITATATDSQGNTSEFSGPLRLADLKVTLDDVDVSDIKRRGDKFILPYRATVSNVGTLAAENAIVRIEGNGELVTAAPHIVTLAACTSAPCPSASFEGEWDITGLFPLGVLGHPVTIILEVKADPLDVIPEFLIEPNEASLRFVADPRPRIDLIKSEFKPNHFFLNGVSLPNKFDVTVDWNGNLDDSQIGLDQKPEVIAFVNGKQKDSHKVTDVFAPARVSIDLGNDLTRGPNLVVFYAVTNLNGLFSEFTEPLQFELGDTVDWINTPFWSVTGTPNLEYDRTAIYKAGFRFPQLATEGFFGVPVDKVGFAGGKFGPSIPAATLRATLNSDKTGLIEGELKWAGEVAGKKVGASKFGEIGGSAEVSALGGFKVVANKLELDTFAINVEVKGFITTPKIPFPPPASFIRAQGKLGLDVGATVQVVEKANGELDWFNEAIVTLQPSLEAIFSIGEDGIASVEVGVGGTALGVYDLDGVPCLDRSATINPFTRLKATFLGFEAQKTFRFTWKEAGCGAGGEGETIVVDPRVFTDIGLIPRYVLDTGGAEPESSAAGLPMVVYPYAKPALARRDDGTMTLVYVNEDPTKPDGQHLEVFASRYDGTSWSTPSQLTDDTLLDDSPSVAYDASGQAVATWARLKNPIADPANTDPTTLLGDFEIMYAVHNPATGLWSAPASLTDNAEMDYLPRLQTNASGDLMAMWLRDSGNDTPVFPDDPTPLGADYRFATWSGTAWSTPATAAPGASTNRAPQFGINGGDGLLVWSQDMDGNVVTDADREIRSSIWNGASWADPAVLAGAGDGLADVAPRVAFDNTGRGNVIWVKEGAPLSEAENDTTDQLYFTEFVAGAFSTPVVAVEAEGISDPKLIIDNDGNPIVVWQGLSASGPDIYYATLDRQSGAWSKPIQFTDGETVEWWFNPFINDDGELEIVYLEREVGSEPLPDNDSGGEGDDPPLMIPNFVGSRLATSVQPLGHDLTVTLLEASEANPAPGSVVQITATIRNSGTSTTPSSALAFFDDGTPIGLQAPVPEIDPGATTLVTVDWTVPANAVAPHILLAQVDPDHQLSEINELNNTASLTTLLPDLVIEFVDATLNNDTITVTTRVLNQGGSPSASPFNVVLRQDNPNDGIVLGTRTANGPLGPGESTAITFTINNAITTLGQRRTGFVNVDSANVIVEVDEANNSGFGALDPLRREIVGLPAGGGPFRVRRDGGDIVVTRQDTTELVREPIAALHQLLLPTRNDVNVVIVDYRAGDPIPAGGLFFSGSESDDSLLLEAGDGGNVIFHGGGGQNSIVLQSDNLMLDLTDPIQNRITNIHLIDIAGSGANVLSVNQAAIAAITDPSNVLRVMSDRDDTVRIDDGWTLTGTLIADNVFFRVLEQGGATLLLNGPADWQNPVDRRDVNNNGIAADPVGDILSLINEINRRNIIDINGVLPNPLLGVAFPEPYYDVNGDGLLTPVGDILSQINFANARNDQEGEDALFGFDLPTSSRFAPNVDRNEYDRDWPAAMSRELPPVRLLTHSSPTLFSQRFNPPPHASATDHLFSREIGDLISSDLDVENLLDALLNSLD